MSQKHKTDKVKNLTLHLHYVLTVTISFRLIKKIRQKQNSIPL